MRTSSEKNLQGDFLGIEKIAVSWDYRILIGHREYFSLNKKIGLEPLWDCNAFKEEICL